MSLLAILVTAGIAVGIAVTGFVYVDSRRRGLARPSRLRRALGCGGGSFGAFLVPHVFAGPLQRLYFQVLKPRPLAASPREWQWVSLGTGLLLAGVVLGLYGAGTRARTESGADGH